MIARHNRFFATVLLFSVALTGAITPTKALAATALEQAMSHIRAKNWDAAETAAQGGGPITRDIVQWHKLRASQGSFADTRAFLDRRPDWPGLKYLRKQSEETIPRGSNANRILAFFKDQPPQTGRGALRMAEALSASGQSEEASAQIVLAWITLSLDSEEQEAFTTRYTKTLKPYHWARTDMLLWGGKTKEAKRMIPLLNKAYSDLTRARIALRRKKDGVDGLIKLVNAELSADPGLAYERFLWRASKGRNQDAVDLLLAQSKSAQTLGEPERWAGWRRSLARWSMRAGKSQQAYRLAAFHHLSGGQSHNDLEWLAGYVALRKLNDPITALEHFEVFHRSVDTPISLGRAGYWQGRAHEAAGEKDAARADYRFAGQYQTSFYGLLGAERAGMAMDPMLTGSEKFAPYKEAPFWNTSVMQAARAFQAIGERSLAERFATHLTESLPRDQIGQLGAWAKAVNEPHLQVMIAKRAAREGLVLHAAYYPTPDIGRGNKSVPRALELAIARRESEFDPVVRSGVGARGLMQLMPGTASDMAKKLGMPYSKQRLTTDPEYNTRLGSEYLAKLINDFGMNPILVSAGYNAGPGRSRSWTERFGSVQSSRTDVIDWIEHIPFRETRNYVMRVSESLPVYRARLTGKTQKMDLSKELKR